MIYFPFGSAGLKLLTLHDFIQGGQVGSEGAQTGTPFKSTFFNLSRRILLAIWHCLASPPKYLLWGKWPRTDSSAGLLTQNARRIQDLPSPRSGVPPDHL
jgi:hypothetical protein